MAATLKDQNIVVMGLGRFGGGIGVTRYLVQQGARVLVTDQSSRQVLEQSVEALSDLDVTFRLGEHREEDFTGADLIVVNPAVKPLGNRYLQAAANAGVPTTSEIRLLIERLPNPRRVIGVTGSAGKSTVTAMIGTILNQSNDVRCFVGGNIGGSLLGKLDLITADDWIVLELSSFMLESLRAAAWSPAIAVVTNLSPNHIDWHGSVDHYYNAKQVIVENQAATDVAIFGPRVAERFQPASRQIPVNDVEASAEIPLLIPGRHNQLNAAVATAVAAEAGVPREQAMAALAGFAGLPHRLQFVCDRGEVRYLNDSKSTTPEAAMLAIESFPTDIVHIILGGEDKQSDLRAMAKLARSRCKAIYTIGRTGDGVATAAEACDGQAEVVRCGTLDAAVEATAARVSRGDVVLLSPGCASWDQYTNFEQRGQRFVEAVLNCTGEGAPPPRSVPTS